MNTKDGQPDCGAAEALVLLIIALLLSIALISQADWQWRWLAIVVFLIVGSLPALLLLVQVTSKQYEQFKNDDEALEALMVWNAWREASLRSGYSSGIIDAPFVLTAHNDDDSQGGAPIPASGAASAAQTVSTRGAAR